jgi:hypothetical protein
MRLLYNLSSSQMHCQQEHHIVDKVKDKAQNIAAIIQDKVQACTSPGAKTEEGGADEEMEDAKE